MKFCGKTAVKLAKSADVVSSICNDVVGDICGIVSGVCAAAIAISIMNPTNFFVNVLISTLISTATITLKAIGKGYAVNNANKIVFFIIIVCWFQVFQCSIFHFLTLSLMFFLRHSLYSQGSQPCMSPTFRMPKMGLYSEAL